MELVRHGTQSLGKHRKGIHANGRLTRAGDEGLTLHTDPVTALQQLPQCPCLLRASLLGQHALNAPHHIADGEELSAPHITQGGDAAKEFHLFTLLECGLCFPGSGGDLESATVGIYPKSTNLVNLLAAYGNQFLLGGTRSGINSLFV